MIKKVYLLAALSLWVRQPVLAAEPAEVLSSFEVFSHDARILADRSWGHLESGGSLAWQEDPKTSFYLRASDPAWAQQSSTAISEALKSVKAPGLDWSGESKLDDERLAELLKPLLPAPSLRVLRLEGTAVTDRSIALINRFTSLETLSLSDAITDDGLSRLQLPHLKELTLGKDRLSNQALKTAAKFKSLRRLDLSGTAVTAAGLPALAGLRLDQLHLGKGIDDQAAATLARLRSLGQLDLSQTKFTDQGLAKLTSLPLLHTLFLPKKITDAGMVSVGKLRRLRRLDLSQTAVTDKGISLVASLSNLEELSLAGTAITDAAAQAMLPLIKLRTLDVSDTRMTEAGIERLGSLQNLQVLSFTSTGRMRLKDLKSLHGLQRLRTVLVNAKPVSFAVVAYVTSTGVSGNGTALGYTSGGPAPWPENTPVESLPTEVLKDRQPSGLTGLHRIHEVESELDHVVPAIETAKIDTEQYTDANFLGEIEVKSVKQKKVH